MIIFLYGPDTYRSRQKLHFYEEGFKKKYDPSGLNVVHLDGAKLTMEEFRRHTGQMGFLANKRFIAVENFLTKNNNKKIQADMAEYLDKGWPDDNVLVFLEEDVKTGRGKKRAKKSVGEIVPFGLERIKEEKFSLLTGEHLNKWIVDEVKKRGAAIAGPAILELSSLVGADLWSMSSEIEKLTNYRNGKMIGADDVRLLVKARYDENIFHLTDALAAKDAGLSFKLLSDQIASGAHELYLLTMLIRQFRILLQVREILEKESNYYTVAARLRLHPFVAQKAIRDARRFTLAELKNIYQQLLEIDIKIKSTQDDPRMLFDLLITRICRK